MDKRLNIIVPVELYERVRKYAWDNRVSFAHIVRVSLVAWLDRQERRAKK